MIKSKRLKIWDTIAIISPSRWWPSCFPLVYENWISILKSLWFKIKEFPTAKMDADFLYKNPKLRAKDINDAFADTTVDWIFTSIWWEDSIRILPYINREIIKNNPKVFIGYSDTTTMHIYFNQLWLVTFYWPSIMSGFSQWDALWEKFNRDITQFLFWEYKTYEYSKYEMYCNWYKDWSDPKYIWETNNMIENSGWKRLQWKWKVTWELFWWCIEVLEWVKWTSFWPSEEFWIWKILFFETSEEKPTSDYIRRVLRNYWVQWIFDKINAVLVWRPRDYSMEEKVQLDETILNVIKWEFWNDELMIVTNMDFWHTDPQWILPLWVTIELDSDNSKFRLLESPFI